MAFITVFEHLKFGKKATMNWTTHWGQFVEAKHDTKIQTVIMYQVQGPKTRRKNSWPSDGWNNNAGGNKISSHSSDT